MDKEKMDFSRNFKKEDLTGLSFVLNRDYDGYEYEDGSKMIVPAGMGGEIVEDEGLEFVLVRFDDWFSEWYVDIKDLYIFYEE